MKQIFDIAIIGGGINGAGIAADAASRGNSVYLCDAQDFGAATSWASSKLIHGGLRYLEHYEFRLVRESLAEREILLRKAPHLIKPLRFILPHRPHLRPAFLIRAGLFLYDNLAGRKTLGNSKSYKFTEENNPLKAPMRRVFEYSDCFVDDARLVIANIISAAEQGAMVENYTVCTKAIRKDDYWEVITLDQHTQEQKAIRAKALVNASGPWAQEFIENKLEQKSKRSIRHIKGSHIIVPKQDIGDKAFILQNEDKRIVFVIPYLDEYTLIGTTDKAYKGDLRQVEIDQEETNYLLDVVNEHFNNELKQTDILASYSGVRPLCDDESEDPSAMTRDYTLDTEDDNGRLPLINIFGGKITTYRRLAEAALEHLQNYLSIKTNTASEKSPLPGAENWMEFSNTAHERYAWLPKPHLNRYLNQYGSRCERLLRACQSIEDLGIHFGADLYSKEVDYLVDYEWVKHADDLLKIRTKLYIKAKKIDVEALQNYIEARRVTLSNNHAFA